MYLNREQENELLAKPFHVCSLSTHFTEQKIKGYNATVFLKDEKAVDEFAKWFKKEVLKIKKEEHKIIIDDIDDIDNQEEKKSILNHFSTNSFDKLFDTQRRLKEVEMLKKLLAPLIREVIKKENKQINKDFFQEIFSRMIENPNL
ncbi:hypothetical protein V3Q90_05300 [Flavobacterium oreochromis]|nr:hypothetical protein [Flavobacterium davisii]